MGVASEADGQDQDVTTIIAAITGGCGGILSCAAVIYVLKLTRRKRVDEKRQEGVVSDRRNSGDWFHECQCMWQRDCAHGCRSDRTLASLTLEYHSGVVERRRYTTGVWCRYGLSINSTLYYSQIEVL